MPASLDASSAPDRTSRWLAWLRELQAMAQTGLHFAQDPYDQERYRRLRELATDMAAEVSGMPSAPILAWHTAEFGYATPKVDTRGVIFRDNRILLVRETADAGRWTLPGGWADVNETPAQAVAREVQEESGYEVRATRLLAVLDREHQQHPPPFPFHVYKLFFLCEIVGGAPQPNAEASEQGWFAEDQLPELSEARVLPRQLHRFFEQVRRGTLPADFD